MARKQKLKQVIVGEPIIETMQSVAPDTDDTLHARMHAAVDEFFSQPTVSWKRMLTAWVVGLTVAVGIGHLGSVLAAYLTVGAVLVSGSAFIGMLVYCLGIIGTMYLSFKVSVFAHMKIIDKSVDAAFISARDSVRGWFGSSAIKSVAA